MKRYALVLGLNVTGEKVASYLPRGYKVIWEGEYAHGRDGVLVDHAVVIQGQDRPGGGFSLQGYILPRLGSGMMAATEIDLSHDVMKLIPIE